MSNYDVWKHLLTCSVGIRAYSFFSSVISDSSTITSPQRCALTIFISHLYSKVRVEWLAVSQYLRLNDPPVIQIMVSQAILGIRWVLIAPFHDLESENKLKDV